QYRVVADEIVCAVDARVDSGQLSLLRGYADAVIRCDVDSDSGIERNWGWLYSLCRGDWTFRIDSDEVASPELVALLPELIRADDVLQYVFPRRWLFPDARHWLNEEPWSLDRNIRLVRNVAALLRFEGIQHSEVDLIWPHRYVEAPIYHLDCILAPQEVRAAKVERYEIFRPGHRTEQGHTVNNAYLPERFATKPAESVPPEVQPSIDQFLGVRSEGVGRLARGDRQWGGGDAAYVRQSEVDRLWAHRTVSESAYQATWLCEPDVSEMQTDELRSIFVVLRNDGTERWPWG